MSRLDRDESPEVLHIELPRKQALKKGKTPVSNPDVIVEFSQAKDGMMTYMSFDDWLDIV